MLFRSKMIEIESDKIQGCVVVTSDSNRSKFHGVFNPETGILRIDDENNLSFWMEIDMERFLKEYLSSKMKKGVYMSDMMS